MSRLSGDRLSLSLGGQPVLTEVSLALEQGEMLGLIGPNGAGKSSLLKLLSGIWKPSRGQPEMDGTPLAAQPPALRARRLAYLTQDGTAHWPISVERIVALGRLPHLGNWQRPAEEDARIIHRVMAQTQLLELADRPFPTLSGGEKARVLLARALAVEPQILIADEPVAALDPSHQLEVMDLLRRHCTDGGSVLVVLHDLRLAAHYCDRLQLLLNGKTLACGGPEEVLTPGNLEQAYGIRLRASGTSTMDAFALTWEKGGG